MVNITIGQIFDKLFCLNKAVNGVVYNDDFQQNIKYKFYTSRYMMDQVFNYIFKNTFEQLDPEHGIPDMSLIRKIVSTEYEVQEICEQIIAKVKPIIQTIGCILKDCNPYYYGNTHVPDIIFKHAKPINKYNELTHQNIYKHHIVLRKEDNNKKSTHKEQAGDWLIYSK